MKDGNHRKSSRTRLEECWTALQSLAGDSVSMIVRPSIFHIHDVCRDYVTIRSASGRVFGIPKEHLRQVLYHIFQSRKITLHQTRIRYSREHAEYIFGICARLPGIRVLECATGLVLVLESLA